MNVTAAIWAVYTATVICDRLDAPGNTNILWGLIQLGAVHKTLQTFRLARLHAPLDQINTRRAMYVEKAPSKQEPDAEALAVFYGRISGDGQCAHRLVILEHGYHV